MRYINRIPRTEIDSKVGDWIQESDLLPNRLLNQKTKFFFRYEMPESENIQIIITLTEEQVSEKIKPIIFGKDMNKIKSNL